MKVREALDALSSMNPDDDICFLLYQRSQFGSPSDPTPKDAWASACTEFECWDTAGDDIGQWLMSAIRENTKEK